MRVAVLGAGASGLVSAKHAIQSAHDVDIFEQSDVIGGTWNYYENPQEDCHSSMYKNLITNLPKEIMTFEGLNYDVNDVSYFSFRTVLKYLNDFADKFNLKEHIKFKSKVIRVSRLFQEWRIIWKNLDTGKQSESFYDAIFICNGHYSVPVIPEIRGISTFKGKLIHSHLYRVPSEFSHRTILTIGMGPSGQDIVFDLCTMAKKVYMSHHLKSYLKNTFPSNSEHRPDVDHFTEDSAVFVDGSSLEVDAVILCYRYIFPFLDESCGIQVDDDYVYPLYKHMINIIHPTMAFIGIPHRAMIFLMLELQAKSFVSILSEKASLPSKDKMQEDLEEWEKRVKGKGLPKRRYHMVINYVRSYLNDIARIGNVEPIPEVKFAIFEQNLQSRSKNLATYREEVFTIVDSETFTVKTKRNQ
ncbi:flavin-containing monooxygenase FMO GS-OX1-like isoform X4 [Cimex lectularius]|uniref:Flavin-containing monooxygenase n=1 Tax=Cimex lectularius TaxID=79782 RepID=A0A8I6S614_CIMLE|nr:flavin-containing monooxygenase FMO GS-OX1-like isoform X4 [Cimex lectularius]